MYLSEDAFIESRSIRDRQLAEIESNRAEEILHKAKALMFAVWQGQGLALTGQIAEFYEVPLDTVQTAIKVNRDEFESDGLKTLRGKALKDVMSIFDISSRTPNLTVWTPRAALRLGMLLRDSAIAKQIRTLLIEMVAQGGGQSSSARELELQVELQKLKQRYQDTGWEIVQATSPAMLAFIRGEQPLVRTEIQYVDRRTGEPLGRTTYRILAQLVEDVGLQRNSTEDQQRVKEILKQERGVDWETGAGLGPGFFIARPLVIPQELYEDYLYIVARHIYGDQVLSGWRYEQQILPEFLKEKGILPGDY
ncbi:hypothetical protein H6G89_31965 [Oscillatoria sp. FACHB-1407]|uniref:hypothetical protein n=1 Tax=Oscillatoria sp. FACHB-1407 TaxID=2692847 RepID=UPI001685C850|nr:hypothetical protein [Oscillatoria sp. FACHB-1407]MBD2465611.1 hypothetical protein [Oscillatoria sp. FACHB-1407]